MSTIRQYELVYIVSPETSEQEVAELHTQVEQIVQRFNGTLDKTENWGRRKLAYEIGHHREGTYVVETISGSRRADEGDRSPSARDRSGHPPLVVRVDEELRVAERTATRARRRGAAAGCARPAARAGSLVKGAATATTTWTTMEGVEVQR